MIITKQRKENLMEALELAIAFYNHKIKIARDFTKLGSVDFCKKCQNKITSFRTMIKILRGKK